MGGIVFATLPTTEPEIDDGIGSGRGGGWVVTVYNNDFNTWDEVMMILQMGTACGPEEAYIETWEIHHQGSSVVHSACENECNRAAAIISTIGIKVTVSEE